MSTLDTHIINLTGIQLHETTKNGWASHGSPTNTLYPGQEVLAEARIVVRNVNSIVYQDPPSGDTLTITITGQIGDKATITTTTSNNAKFQFKSSYVNANEAAGTDGFIYILLTLKDISSLPINDQISVRLFETDFLKIDKPDYGTSPLDILEVYKNLSGSYINYTPIDVTINTPTVDPASVPNVDVNTAIYSNKTSFEITGTISEFEQYASTYTITTTKGWSTKVSLKFTLGFKTSFVKKELEIGWEFGASWQQGISETVQQIERFAIGTSFPIGSNESVVGTIQINQYAINTEFSGKVIAQLVDATNLPDTIRSTILGYSLECLLGTCNSNGTPANVFPFGGSLTGTTGTLGKVTISPN